MSFTDFESASVEASRPPEDIECALTAVRNWRASQLNARPSSLALRRSLEGTWEGRWIKMEEHPAQGFPAVY